MLPVDDPQVLQDEFAEYATPSLSDPLTSPGIAVPTGPGMPCYGVAVIEGVETGDDPRREFAPGSLTFAPTPFTLKWQPAEDEGHDGAVVAGRVDAIWRDGALIRFIGVMDSSGEYGAEAQRLIGGQFVTGVSIMADDTEEQDVELVYPEVVPAVMPMALDTPPVTDGPAYAAPPAVMPDMDMEPIKVIIHAARIRSLTILPEPAFVEATICLGESPHLPPNSIPEPVVIAAAVGAHSTATSDGAWDGPGNEKRLPSPMPVATARAAYAWVDDSTVTDGEVPKTGARFIHHEVNADGSPGAANVKACQTGIGVLNGGRGGTTIPGDDMSGTYEHLAAHLRDAGLEPPPLTAAGGPHTVTAAAYTITIPEVWPEHWFDEPAEMPPFGAIHITPQGRVFGLLGPDRVNHRGFRASGRNVTIPRGVDYSEFQNKACLVAGADGGVYRINAGTITFGCGHASPVDPRRADPSWANQHYENSCSVAARVRVGENRMGTWVAGGLMHDIAPETVERMMACALSGDWQGNALKAALLVPVEGFPTRVNASVRVRDDALVASSVPLHFVGPPEPADYGPVFDLIASANGRDAQTLFASYAEQRFADYAAERR